MALNSGAVLIGDPGVPMAVLTRVMVWLSFAMYTVRPSGEIARFSRVGPRLSGFPGVHFA